MGNMIVSNVNTITHVDKQTQTDTTENIPPRYAIAVYIYVHYAIAVVNSAEVQRACVLCVVRFKL